MEIINDSNNQVILRQGETLTHAVELDVIIYPESPQNRVQVCRTEIGENTNGGDEPSWEEVNKINNTPLPVAVSLISDDTPLPVAVTLISDDTPLPVAVSLIPDDILDETRILPELKEIEYKMTAHLVDTFVKAKTNITTREQIALGLLLLM